MRDAFVITLTLIVLFVLVGYTYNLMSPYFVKLGFIEKPAEKLGKEPDGGVFRSDDFGRTWMQKSKVADGKELNKSDVFGLEFSPEDARVVYAATSKGLFVSTDSANTWTGFLGEGVVSANESVVAFAIDKKDPRRMYFAAHEKDRRSRILKTKGAGFYEVYSTAATDNKITGLWLDSFDSSVIYAGTARGFLLQSRDFGESWRIQREFGGVISDLEMTPQDTRIIYIAVNGKIFKTTNPGENWQEIVFAPLAAGDGAILINDIAVSPQNKGAVYVATNKGLFRSKDSGQTFSPVDLPIAPESASVSAIHISSQKPDLLMLGVGSEIYKSDDAGESWQIKNLPAGRKVSVIKFKPDDIRIIFAGVKQ